MIQFECLTMDFNTPEVKIMLNNITRLFKGHASQIAASDFGQLIQPITLLPAQQQQQANFIMQSTKLNRPASHHNSPHSTNHFVIQQPQHHKPHKNHSSSLKINNLLMSQGKLAASTTVSYHQQDLTKTNNHQAPLPTTQTYQNSNHHPKTTTINRLISAEPTTITKKQQQQHAALLRTFNDSLKSDPHTNLASLSAQPITLLPFNFSENGVATAQSQQMVDSANIITLVPMSLPGGVAPAILSHTEAFVQQETVVTTSNEEEEEEVSVNEVIVKNEAVVNSPAETVQESRSEEKLAREVEVKGPVMQKQKLFAVTMIADDHCWLGHRTFAAQMLR